MLPTVQIFGVQSYHKTESLIDEVKLALTNLSFPVQIELISDLERMMEIGITGIPALIVDGHVLIQGDTDKQKNIQEMISGAWQSKVLTPVDYSSASKTSLNYAVSLSKLFLLNIHLLHIYPELPVPNDRVLAQSKEAKLRVLDQMMQGLVEKAKSSSKSNKLTIKSEIRTGTTAKEIIRESRRPNTKIMVLTNEIGHLSVNTETIIRHASCPILLVQSKQKFKKFKRIIVAADHGGLSAAHRKFLADFVRPMRSKLTYVHIQANKKDKITLTETGDPLANYTRKESHLEDDLLAIAAKERSDLIVLFARNRHLWQELFHRSFTKHLALKSKISILILPSE